jgi:ABC-type transporter Mla subunit MlaD
MTKARADRGTRAARVGLAALVFVLLAAVGLFFIVKYTRGNGYQIGVHFTQAAGVSAGSQVFLNGVVIGGVTKVKILPDTTVDFIINVFHDTSIPKSAQFSVRASLTGMQAVIISVPPRRVAASDIWPKRVLPIEEQPVGTPPITLENLMSQNESLANRSLRVLALARPYGKPLMQHLQDSRANGAATVQTLRGTLPSLMTSV